MTKTTQTMIPADYIKLRMTALGFEMPATKEARIERTVALVAAFRPALESAFSAVNGKADAFTLNASDAITLAIETEQRLAAMGVPKGDRSGVVVTMSSAGPDASAYKHRAIGTKFSLRRDSKGSWALVDVTRIDVFPKQTAKSLLTVSAAARDAIIRNAMDGIQVAA